MRCWKLGWGWVAVWEFGWAHDDSDAWRWEEERNPTYLYFWHINKLRQLRHLEKDPENRNSLSILLEILSVVREEETNSSLNSFPPFTIFFFMQLAITFSLFILHPHLKRSLCSTESKATAVTMRDQV